MQEMQRLQTMERLKTMQKLEDMKKVHNSDFEKEMDLGLSEETELGILKIVINNFSRTHTCCMNPFCTNFSRNSNTRENSNKKWNFEVIL